MKTKKRVVVFGGSGFLGSHVCDALSDEGYAVRVFDKAPSPYLRRDQEMLIGDLLDAEAVRRAAHGCKVVYNFAGVMDIDESIRKPVETLHTNIIGNANALEAARQGGAERFVLASTVYVYSRSGSFYRVSKQACEQATETYHEEFGLDYTILRYGSLYGRRADMRNGIYRLLHGALTEGKVRYGGTGEELREYVHVEDAARLSVEALKPEYADLHLVVTGHHPMRVRDVMEMVREILQGKVRLEFSNEEVAGHYRTTPYTYHPRVGKKLVSTLYTDLGQGLLDCLTELRSQLASESAGPQPRPKRSARARG
ncbi:MAG: NAD(P)-dependent oxidoreductase [Elusimicrobia bacterium]|nr:NAD(P)-dependent oxidoreductase [Elusimicrobiota bacterium]